MRYLTTRGLRDHRVQHGDHAPANRRTQINMLFSVEVTREYDDDVWLTHNLDKQDN